MIETKVTEMTVRNWGTQQIETKYRPLPCVPLFFHYKSDGAVDDQPSIAIESSFHVTTESDLVTYSVIGEMSINTLKQCLEALGYTISLIPKTP